VKCFVELAGFCLFKYYFECSVRVRRDISVCKMTWEDLIICMSQEVKLCEWCLSYIIHQLSKSTVYICCTGNDLADSNKLYSVL